MVDVKLFNPRNCCRKTINFHFFFFFWQLPEKCQISTWKWDNLFTTYKDAYVQTLFMINKMSTWFLNNDSNRYLTFNKIQIVKLTHFSQTQSKILWSKWYWISIRVKPLVFVNFHQERFTTCRVHLICRCYLIILKVYVVQYYFIVGLSFLNDIIDERDGFKFNTRFRS